MDEAFNLATYLVGIDLRLFSYWSNRAIDLLSNEYSEDDDSEDMYSEEDDDEDMYSERDSDGEEMF
jgi:hypothetical protein